MARTGPDMYGSPAGRQPGARTMTDTIRPSIWRPDIPGFTPVPQILPDNRYAAAALERHKREGLELAVRARIAAMAVIAVVVGFLTPWPAALYYETIIVVFVLIGLAQRRLGKVGQNRSELVLLFCDLALMTAVCVLPNPLDDREWPLAFQYRFETFLYFFVILAGATLAYSWRTIVAVGTWTVALWTLGAVGIWVFRDDPAGWQSAATALYPDNPTLAEFMDPSALLPDVRVQEAVVFLIVAVTLAVSVRRFNLLVLDQAEVARERANLARYFSPNVVDELSHNDEPLKRVRSQDVAVMFVDIVGFTSFAADRSPEEVIATLRDFHGRMEAEVFRHEGTLDKYLGDGLMATFGTPVARADDAARALACARAMLETTERFNAERRAAGQPAIRASIGLHHGPAVLGDIGANRLEFAVIGTTVNIASRLEALSRPLGVRLVVSDAAIRSGGEGAADAGFVQRPAQTIRGVAEPLDLWTLT